MHEDVSPQGDSLPLDITHRCAERVHYILGRLNFTKRVCRCTRCRGSFDVVYEDMYENKFGLRDSPKTLIKKSQRNQIKICESEGVRRKALFIISQSKIRKTQKARRWKNIEKYSARLMSDLLEESRCRVSGGMRREYFHPPARALCHREMFYQKFVAN